MMLIKVDEDLYINDSAILTIQKGDHGFVLEMVNGNKLTVSEETAAKFIKKPGRPRKEGNNGSDK